MKFRVILPKTATASSGATCPIRVIEEDSGCDLSGCPSPRGQPP
jgi:hypothetical protein